MTEFSPFYSMYNVPIIIVPLLGQLLNFKLLLENLFNQKTN